MFISLYYYLEDEENQTYGADTHYSGFFFEALTKLTGLPQQCNISPELSAREVALLRSMTKCERFADEESESSDNSIDIFEYKYHDVPQKDTICQTELSDLIANESMCSYDLIKQGMKKKK